MTNEPIKPPTWFWVVAAIALLWNLMGVLAYLGEAFATPEMLESMPSEQRDLIENRPAWATAAYALAVWGGLLGCIFLLLKKGIAQIVFIVSLAGILIQMAYNLFIAESTLSYGPGQVAMVIMIPLIGVLLVFLAKRGKSEEWLS